MRNKKGFGDYARGYNNGVIAVFITAEDILEVENRPDLIGVPFLVWDGSWTPIGEDVEKAREIVGVPYISKQQWEVLYGQLVNSKKYPEVFHVRGKTYTRDKMWSWYVPYSFSVGHKEDLQNSYKIRGLSDYDRLLNEVMPQVHEIRRQRELPINKVLSFFGLYKSRVCTL